jgi:hypothetical protein
MGDWKLVLNGTRPEDWNEAAPQPAKKAKKAKKKAADGGDSIELFNIKTDPYEKTNLADKEPEKAKQLKARLDVFAHEAVPPKIAPQASDFKVPKVWGEQ